MYAKSRGTSDASRGRMTLEDRLAVGALLGMRV